MIARLKKDITIDNVKFHKSMLGTIIACKWTDKGNEQYLIQFEGGTCLVDKSDAEIDKKV